MEIVKYSATVPLNAAGEVVVAIGSTAEGGGGGGGSGSGSGAAISTGDYVIVPASQMSRVLGTTGAVGDFIAGILIIPESLSPGEVTLLDSASAITLFPGGTVPSLAPFSVQLGMVSTLGPWKLTTGANVRCVATGNFT